MKTTRETSVENKLIKLVTEKKIHKNEVVYNWIKNYLNGTNQFRPVYVSGRFWRHSTLYNRVPEFTTLLNNLGLEYTLTNDAPRGGRCGALITITTKVRKTKTIK